MKSSNFIRLLTAVGLLGTASCSDGDSLSSAVSLTLPQELAWQYGEVKILDGDKEVALTAHDNASSKFTLTIPGGSVSDGSSLYANIWGTDKDDEGYAGIFEYSGRANLENPLPQSVDIEVSKGVKKFYICLGGLRLEEPEEEFSEENYPDLMADLRLAKYPDSVKNSVSSIGDGCFNLIIPAKNDTALSFSWLGKKLAVNAPEMRVYTDEVEEIDGEMTESVTISPVSCQELLFTTKPSGKNGCEIDLQAMPSEGTRFYSDNHVYADCPELISDTLELDECISDMNSDHFAALFGAGMIEQNDWAAYFYGEICPPGIEDLPNWSKEATFEVYGEGLSYCEYTIKVVSAADSQVPGGAVYEIADQNESVDDYYDVIPHDLVAAYDKYFWLDKYHYPLSEDISLRLYSLDITNGKIEWIDEFTDPSKYQDDKEYTLSFDGKYFYIADNEMLDFDMSKNPAIFVTRFVYDDGVIEGSRMQLYAPWLLYSNFFGCEIEGSSGEKNAVSKNGTWHFLQAVPNYFDSEKPFYAFIVQAPYLSGDDAGSGVLELALCTGEYGEGSVTGDNCKFSDATTDTCVAIALTDKIADYGYKGAKVLSSWQDGYMSLAIQVDYTNPDYIEMSDVGLANLRLYTAEECQNGSCKAGYQLSGADGKYLEQYLGDACSVKYETWPMVGTSFDADDGNIELVGVEGQTFYVLNKAMGQIKKMTVTFQGDDSCMAATSRNEKGDKIDECIYAFFGGQVTDGVCGDAIKLGGISDGVLENAIYENGRWKLFGGRMLNELAIQGADKTSWSNVVISNIVYSSPSALLQPTSMAYDAKNDRLLVTDLMSGKLLAINMADGARSVVAENLGNPADVKVLSDGSIYVASFVGNVPVIYSEDGVDDLIAEKSVGVVYKISADGNAAVVWGKQSFDDINDFLWFNDDGSLKDPTHILLDFGYNIQIRSIKDMSALRDIIPQFAHILSVATIDGQEKLILRGFKRNVIGRSDINNDYSLCNLVYYGEDDNLTAYYSLDNAGKLEKLRDLPADIAREQLDKQPLVFDGGDNGLIWGGQDILACSAEKNSQFKYLYLDDEKSVQSKTDYSDPGFRNSMGYVSLVDEEGVLLFNNRSEGLEVIVLDNGFCSADGAAVGTSIMLSNLDGQRITAPVQMRNYWENHSCGVYGNCPVTFISDNYFNISDFAAVPATSDRPELLCMLVREEEGFKVKCMVDSRRAVKYIQENTSEINLVGG